MAERSTPTPTQSELPARLLRTALLFAIGFMVVRTALVEPFGVPTGSMAPTLLGNHRECPCPRCGYPVIVCEMPGADRRNPYANATCDNCGKRGIEIWKVIEARATLFNDLVQVDGIGKRPEAVDRSRTAGGIGRQLDANRRTQLHAPNLDACAGQPRPG